MRRFIEQQLMLPEAGGAEPGIGAPSDAPAGAADPRAAGQAAPGKPVVGKPEAGRPAAGATPFTDSGAAAAGRVIPAPGEATRAQVEGLQAIAAECASCTACALGATRKNSVPGAGHPAARLVLVGEGPGENEDEQGLPFVGMAGKLLTKMLAAIHLDREEVFITNIVKCRPPGNRVPHDEEIAACRGYLERQVDLIAPDLIVTLGAPSTRFFLETPEVKITKIRGQVFQWRGIPLIPTLHPAYLLRQSSAKKDAWEDLKTIRDFLAHRPAASRSKRSPRT